MDKSRNTTIKLQNILLPRLGVCTEEMMFFRKENVLGRDREVQWSGDELSFSKNGTCTFDTYFNALTISKWKKYTNIGDIQLNLWLKGDFEVTLINHVTMKISNDSDKKKDKYDREDKEPPKGTKIGQKIVRAERKALFAFPYKLYEYKGLLFFSLKALSDDSKFYGGWYSSSIDEDKLVETNIAINICTFKREPFIMRNIDILRKHIIDDPSNPLHDHLQFYISDNGNTLPLDKLNSDVVHVVPNKNVGGAGGFTRGLMEILKHSADFPATHALMMDDDVVIEPESLYRTYMLLCCRKEQYKDMFIGGAMIRLDEQNIQWESGASWNAGKLISNKCRLDLNKVENVFYNELEEYVEYNAWWYCCTPMSLVNPENLPIPIFIRGDDLEYGLRNMKTLVLMNGICVWHEPFENKYSSFLQYYILRNMMYDNTIHFKDFGTISVLANLYKNVGRDLIYYRYKNIDLIFRGVNDYLKGTRFLLETDGEKLHKEIMAAGYKGVPVEQLKDASLHLPIYYDSLIEGDGRLHRLFRLATFNGYLLPTKSMKNKKDMKSVSMAQCRPINFYRQSKVVNYDAASGKAFVTEKSISQALKAMFGLIGMTFKIIFGYKRARKDLQDNYGRFTCEAFWTKYLNM